MSKRVLRLVSILFLSSILVLSCSNANKTGSGDNNNGNGGSSTGGSGSGIGNGGTGTGGDGGTTPQGIAKYAGTWTAKFNVNSSYDVVISDNGTVTIKDGSQNPKQATDIVESGNTYTMKIDHGTATDIDVTITFNNESSGTIDDGSFWKGSIQKNN